MRRNQGNNGLTIENNIELVEVVSSKTSVIAYILEAIMVVFLCLSILYCFLSGMKIKINVAGLNIRVIMYVGILFVLFLYKRYIKFTLPVVILIYLLVGFYSWDSIQAGFVKVVNSIIDLNNIYYHKNLEKLSYDFYELAGNNNAFIYYISFLLTGILCYIILYARYTFTYLIVTLPITFSCFFFGYVPSLAAYTGYIAGTVGVIGSIISEKHSCMHSKAKGNVNVIPYIIVNRSKLIIQYLSIAMVLVVLTLAYTLYSPERYDKEFKGDEIRVVAQQKFNELMSGELLKDTFFGKLFQSKAASGGINKGILNGVGEINFDHKPALKITIEDSAYEGACYLRGYVGEEYNTYYWEPLSKEDQERLKGIEEGFAMAYNSESLSSAMFNLLENSPYNLITYNTRGMEVENINADSSVDYIPYNTLSSIGMEKGNLTADSNYYMYISLQPPMGEGSPLSELFRNSDFVNTFKLNLINSTIYEQYYQVDMTENWASQVSIEKQNTLGNSLYRTNNPTYNVSLEDREFQESLVTSTANLYQGEEIMKDTFPLYLNRDDYVLNLGNTIVDFNAYARDENAYFNFAREVYTKLPEEGLEKVKELVKDHQVQIEPTVLNGENYSTISQIGGILSVDNSYRTAEGNFLYEGDFPVREDDESIQGKYYEAIEYVRNYLAQNTSYSLKPGTAPSGEDYVEYFLFTNKKGFCVHYATAATVMLRAMGVPARYAEGYVITKDDFENANSINQSEGNTSLKDKFEMDILDTNAHAWVEVYLPGLGWQPIEMTAPYIYDSDIEVPPVNNDPTATLKPTPSPTPTVKPSSKPTVSPKPTVKATPTAKPRVTKSPASTNNQLGFFGGLKSWYEQLNTTVKVIIKTCLTLLLLLIIFIIGLYIRYFLVRGIRSRKMQKLTNNQMVLYENTRLDKVLKHFNLTYYSSEPYGEFVENLNQKFDFVDKEQALNYYEIVLKARFNKEQITDEEQLKCKKFYEAYVAGLCNNTGKIVGWIYRKRWIL